MSVYGEQRVWLEEIPLGEPQAFGYDYLGLRYSGEVIRANGWDPVWGEPLTGELDLGAQSRRLNNLLVENIMRGAQDQRLEDLHKIIQASDLSALCNTLSPELAGFIGRVLR